MYPPTEPPPDDELLTQDLQVPEELGEELAPATPDLDTDIQDDALLDDEEEKKAFVDLLQFARQEDRRVRDSHLTICKRLDYYWNNILDIFYDPIARDWQVPNWDELEDELPPRLINIFRPHGEAIVAALSVTIPAVMFNPDDAENPEDLETAKAYGNIVKLLQSHNNGSFLFIKALVSFFKAGTVFGYNYYHKDPKYGTVSRPNIEYQDVQVDNHSCPQCGMPTEPNDMGMVECPQCGYMGPTENNPTTERLPQIVGFVEEPKGMVCQEIFDSRAVKVPYYAKSQSECGYLLLEFAQSAAMLRSIFSEKADTIQPKRQTQYEDFARMPAQYLGDRPDNTCNVSCLWIRPWQFWAVYTVNQRDIIDSLVSKYPDGCYAIFIDDDFIEAYPEKMDDHWTISEDPLSQTIYGRPLGENLATVQDIRATLVEIELQTAEFGIPEKFADPRVIDFEKYGEGRAKPGMITPAKPRSGRTLQESFYESKPATLSQEIDPLRQHIDQDAQFVSGSYPSVYGGPATGGSKTASEYAQSKASALQRLNTTWKVACEFWSRFQARSAVEYATLLKDTGQDDKLVQKQGSSFLNVWIRSASLTGKIGHVEPESTEQLPISWAQKKDAIFQLLQSPIPEVISVLVHPNNAGLMKKVIGVEELYIPGEEDRIRQTKEFSIMLQGIPVPVNQYDNHDVHVAVLSAILEGPLGEQVDSNILQICEMHLQEHLLQAAMTAPQPGEEGEEGNVSNERPASGGE